MDGAPRSILPCLRIETLGTQIVGMRSNFELVTRWDLLWFPTHNLMRLRYGWGTQRERSGWRWDLFSI